MMIRDKIPESAFLIILKYPKWNHQKLDISHYYREVTTMMKKIYLFKVFVGG